MPYAVNVIETGSPDYPQPLKITDNSARYPQIWSIGNLEILNKKLLGFFCSVKCPGDIILKTYDLARSFRDAGIPLISGFHSPIEKDVFDLVLSGFQPLVVCPARSIENMRIPNAWKEAIDNGRLLLLSPFKNKHKRVTAEISDKRNRFVALLATDVFLPYAAPGSQSENLCKDIIGSGKHTEKRVKNRKILYIGRSGERIRVEPT
jgi:predicted Rossmann fold nucleotide-binding protein DprA/Smf involved in DNA uptake